MPEGFNPASRIEKNREQGRERFLTTDELERLGSALREAETIGLPWDVNVDAPKAKHLPKEENRRTVISPHATAAIRLLILTGCRLREILHLRWAEVDFERGMLHLPDSKTGRKSVVLNAPALAVLDGVPRVGEFVIAGRPPQRKGQAERPRSDLKKPGPPSGAGSPRRRSHSRPSPQLRQRRRRGRAWSADRRQAARPHPGVDDAEVRSPRQRSAAARFERDRRDDRRGNGWSGERRRVSRRATAGRHKRSRG